MARNTNRKNFKNLTQATCSPPPRSYTQFELVDEARESEVLPPKKKRSKVIKDDDDEEAEWDQDDLQDSGGDDGSAYEVQNCRFT